MLDSNNVFIDALKKIGVEQVSNVGLADPVMGFY
jgi:hypothetical protein